MGTLRETGFDAERLRDQEGRRDDALEGGDVGVPLCGVAHTIECKHVKDGFSAAYDALEKPRRSDIAVVKQNHKRDSLVIVRLSTWLEHIRLAESYRAPPLTEAAE